MENLEVLTPDSSRWDEFCNRLEGPEGCNFTPDLKWRCGGGTDKSFARAIMKSMGGVDIEASCQFFEDHGGFCDCEILFNVDIDREDDDNLDEAEDDDDWESEL